LARCAQPILAEALRVITRACAVRLCARHVFRTHVGWLYENGALTGYLNDTETDGLSKDGYSYTANNELKLFALNGNLKLDVTGTASATRIAPSRP
jgi:hypothetical protein